MFRRLLCTNKNKLTLRFLLFVLPIALVLVPRISGADEKISDDSSTCIDCHTFIHPGIVASWKKSRMARVTPGAAKALPPDKKRVSFERIPETLGQVVVGCAECHTLNAEKHKDSFDHNGYRIHVVVTPRDCATCHPVEKRQYEKNLMSHAYGNLKNNVLYSALVAEVTGIRTFSGTVTHLEAPDEKTLADSCYHCHGTHVQVRGKESRETPDGEMTFPVLSGWPNQGVGRINPDGSKGSCTACHTRHRFSIEMARKPYTCSQCHKGPDVPAFKVYSVSKHGNTYSTFGNTWNFDAVPWRVGKDFTAPTCATCHVSLLASAQGDLLAKRTHQMNNRLPWRIFGLIYAHPHPKSPDTAEIKNKEGLPLPTELTGEPVTRFLINAAEQEERRKSMEKVCSSCHSSTWVGGHFERLEKSIKTTNQLTLTATKILLSAWENGVAGGPESKEGIFNETIEKKWVEQWLFYANSTRYSSAMMGADYGVFANGRWYMSRNIREMLDLLKAGSKHR